MIPWYAIRDTLIHGGTLRHRQHLPESAKPATGTLPLCPPCTHLLALDRNQRVKKRSLNYQAFKVPRRNPTFFQIHLQSTSTSRFHFHHQNLRVPPTSASNPTLTLPKPAIGIGTLHFGTLVRWYAGTSVCRYVGTLVRWYFTEVRRYPDAVDDYYRESIERKSTSLHE